MIYRNYSIVLFKDVSIEHYEEETEIKKKKKSFIFVKLFVQHPSRMAFSSETTCGGRYTKSYTKIKTFFLFLYFSFILVAFDRNIFKQQNRIITINHVFETFL